jgi:GTP-binding protein HflX
LVSVCIGRRDDPDAVEELKQLVVSAGIEPVGIACVRRDRPDPAHYIGGGKVEEVKAQANAAGAGFVIFDAALTPAQQRNLERALDLWVLDRTALILYIFSQRARSREGKLQVELAQLDHLSTRLVRGWSHLERQRGGLGKTGGPGEKQIELDRRMIGARVKQLRLRLKQLERQRRTRRRARGRNDVLSVSLVGYTNAGKSTLFNALTRSGAYAADQLFATLDTTSRRCHLGEGSVAVLSDTVGFIRGLPHSLIAAFKSTLDETAEADLLLHVVDAASPARAEQMAAVDRVLDEIGAAEVPRIVVYNKIDVLGRAPSVERDPCDNIVAVSVSAQQGLGMDLLRGAIAEFSQRHAAGAVGALGEHSLVSHISSAAATQA